MRQRKRRAYPDAEKAAAVEMYLNSPPSETLRSMAHALGMSQSSLHNWVQDHRRDHPEDQR